MTEIIFQITENDMHGGFIARPWGMLREAVLCHFVEGKAPVDT